jgi:hypothetical protein
MALNSVIEKKKRPAGRLLIFLFQLGNGRQPTQSRLIAAS